MIFLILSVFIIGNLIGLIAVVLLRVEQANPILAPITILCALAFLLLLLWRFEWLKKAGVASLGSWRGWAVALLLLIYYLLALIYSFFGEFSFSVPAEAVSGLGVPSVLIGAILEEVLFRGVILYALVSVWGTNRKGILKAAAISAFLFSVTHAANLTTGDPSEIPGQISIALFEGIWWSVIVLRWKSIWPTVLIHAVTNWALQTKAFGIPDFHGTTSSYALAILFGLPLAVLGVWWILRTDPAEISNR